MLPSPADTSVKIYCILHRYQDNQTVWVVSIRIKVSILRLRATYLFREKPFIERITKQRAKQVHYVRKTYLIQMFIDWLFFSLSPFIMLSSTFVVYALYVNAELFTPEKAFVVILIFNLLDFAIESLPSTVGNFEGYSFGNNLASQMPFNR